MSDREHIQSLTGLRGIAAVAVLGYHAAEIGFPGAANLGLARGYLAVDLFFFLSGFVLAHAYGGRFAKSIAPKPVLSFLWARIARIYPVHIAMLIGLMPLYGTRADFSGGALLMSVLLLQGPWLTRLVWNYAAWSISAEWHSYIAFPWLVGPMLRDKRVAWRLAGISAAAILFVVTKAGTANLTDGVGLILRAIPEFIIGIALYRLFISAIGAPYLRRDAAFMAALCAVIALSLVPGSDAAIIMGLAVLLLAAAHNAGRAARILESGPAQWLGKISYSLYMVQMVPTVLIVSERPWINAMGVDPPIIAAAAFALLCFAIAIPASYLTEYPARAYLRLSRKDGSAGAVPHGI